MPPPRRYLENELFIPPIDAGTLRILQSAIHRSLPLLNTVEANDMTIYSGAAGIVLMFLRLHLQSPALETRPATPAIYFHGPPPRQLNPGRLSPLDAEHGPYTIELLRSLITKQVPQDDLFVPLRAALSVSLGGASDNAAHEVLYGTAGLLAALISARRLGASHHVVSLSSIQNLAERLIEDGRAGAARYASRYEPGLPLMWSWRGKYYLGAMHGVAGILTILLQLPPEIRDPMMKDTLLPATYALLGQVDADGHLPSSLPRHRRASGELVQLCHGAPGALLLIAALRSACAGQTLPPQLDAIEDRLSDRVWAEGLLVKGISVCHGVVGNAWPWLLLSQVRDEPEKRDLYLSRALAFLLHATELPPLGNREGYNTPDDPYSLFTGLAGAVCAWSEARTILHDRLSSTESNTPGEPGTTPGVLGMPWLGGLGICGI